MDAFLLCSFIYFIQIAEIFALMAFGQSILAFLKIRLSNFKLPILPLILASTGVIGLSLSGTIINFYFPLNSLFSSGIWLLGLILFVKNKVVLSRILSKSIKYILLLVALVYAISLGWGIQLADTFGYHILASKWVAESPMPVGQANLDVRLGYNSIIFTTYAITDFLLFKINKPLFSFIPIFVSLFLYASITLLFRGIRKNKSLSFSDYYLASFLLIASIYNRSFGSLSTDLAGIIFAWQTFYLATLDSEYPRNSFEIQRLIILFSFFTITIKLSMIPLALLPLCYLLWSLKSRKFLKEMGLICIIGILSLSIFFIKGYIQSSYPAFPNHLFSIDTEWKVSESIARAEAEFICNFCKDYRHSRDLGYMKSYKWIPRYIINFIIYERGLWLFYILAGLVIMKFAKKLNKIQKLIQITSVIAIIFYLFTAPAARFAHAFLFSLILVPFCTILSSNEKLDIVLESLNRSKIISMVVAIVLTLIAVFFTYDNYFGNRFVDSALLKLFPVTQKGSLVFVYATFSLSLICLASLAFYIALYIKKQNKIALAFSTKKLFIFIILISGFAHLSLEFPAIFGSHHTRLKFVDSKIEVNSNNGITTYNCTPYANNIGLLYTTYKNPNLKVRYENGRYYFSTLTTSKD